MKKLLLLLLPVSLAEKTCGDETVYHHEGPVINDAQRSDVLYKLRLGMLDLEYQDEKEYCYSASWVSWTKWFGWKTWINIKNGEADYRKYIPHDEEHNPIPEESFVEKGWEVGMNKAGAPPNTMQKRFKRCEEIFNTLEFRPDDWEFQLVEHEFAKVAGNERAGDDYWEEVCKKIPEDAEYLKLVMGDVVDYYKPADGKNFCDMLTEKSQHAWSNNAIKWTKPDFHYHDHAGGSIDWWPRDKVEGDNRRFISFWGSDVGWAGAKGGCCQSEVGPDAKVGWGQSFTFYYAAPTKRRDFFRFAKIDGKEKNGDAFWKEECKKIPLDTEYVMIKMGEIIDYYKPTGAKDFCDMLTSNDKHLWSKDGINWIKPEYSGELFRGGSLKSWPKENISGEEREFLTFWGKQPVDRLDISGLGGCCQERLGDNARELNWGIPFEMFYAKPSPKNDHLLADVPGDLRVGDSYWEEVCRDIPRDTEYVKVVMGSVVDYFKPIGGKTFCEMLTEKTQHMWSNDAINWVLPKQHYHDHNGGSYDWWPLDDVPGDERRFLSFWGSDENWSGAVGGCCSTELNDEGETGWGKPFQMYYHGYKENQEYIDHSSMRYEVEIDDCGWLRQCYYFSTRCEDDCAEGLEYVEREDTCEEEKVQCADLDSTECIVNLDCKAVFGKKMKFVKCEDPSKEGEGEPEPTKEPVKCKKFNKNPEKCEANGCKSVSKRGKTKCKDKK